MEAEEDNDFDATENSEDDSFINDDEFGSDAGELKNIIK